MRTMTLLSLLLLLATTSTSAEDQASFGPLVDEFDGKLALDWKIARPDEEHFSLEKEPGALVIATQDGMIFGQESRKASNMFLLDLPEDAPDNFVVTTCLRGFRPSKPFHQAGLLLFNDMDNYFRWIIEPHIHFDRPGLNAAWEKDTKTSVTVRLFDAEKERCWLRVIKRGDLYQCCISHDGENWIGDSIMHCGLGRPKQVGIYAANGTTDETTSSNAVFECFELRALHEEEESDPAIAGRLDLQGDWRAVRMASSGEEIEEFPGLRMKLTDVAAFLIEEDGEQAFQYAIRPDTNPKQLLLFSDMGVFPKPIAFAYELQDGRLTICSTMKPGKDAPDKVETTEGDGRVMLVLERVKEEDEDADDSKE